MSVFPESANDKFDVDALPMIVFMPAYFMLGIAASIGITMAIAITGIAPVLVADRFCHGVGSIQMLTGLIAIGLLAVTGIAGVPIYFFVSRKLFRFLVTFSYQRKMTAAWTLFFALNCLPLVCIFAHSAPSHHIGLHCAESNDDRCSGSIGRAVAYA